jgi:hypothetical protein
MNTDIKNGYGPWSQDDETERRCQLRSLTAIAHLQLGQDHPLVPQLRAAEIDKVAFTLARETIEELPALTRRHLLSAFSAINFPPRARART